MGTLEPSAPERAAPRRVPVPPRDPEGHRRALEALPRPARGARTLANVALALVPVEEGFRLPDGPHILVAGRVMDLILAVAAHAAELERLPKGALELHWGPNGVTGRVHTQWEPTLTPDLYTALALQPPAPPAPAPSPDSPRRRGRGKRPPASATVAVTPEVVTIHGDEEPPWVMLPVR